MSCYHPLTIPNPKLVKNIYDKKVIEVPCGKCPACKDTRRMSWFVRLYYEWQYCIDNHGFALYETLTYNNEHLPHCLSEYDVFDRKLFPCFSVRDIQLYLKKIRKRIKYFGYDIEFKYFLSMEYGGKTHRPHYHIVFFVPTSKISPWFFKRIVEEKWIENGFVKAGKLNNGFVCSQGGLSYCAKYVCKDIYEDAYFRRLDNTLRKFGFDREQYKDCFPHNMQSNNLGIYALEMDKYNDLNNFFNGDIYLPDKDNEIKKYKLPLYYERKIFYDVRYRFYDSFCSDYILVDKLSDVPAGCEYSPVYVLNDLGLEMKDVRLQKSLDAVKNVYRVIQSVPELPTFLKKLNEKFETKFESVNVFQKYIQQTLPEELFVAYSLVYRGCTTNHTCCCCSTGNTNAYYDYMLVNNLSRGVRPLSVDFDNFCYNVEAVNNVPYIEDNYKMIRYFYYLINLSLEELDKDKEMKYVDQKTAYLENAVSY